MKKILSLLLLATLLVSCDNKVNPPMEEAKPMQLTSVQKTRVAQDNDFAFDLMKQTLVNTTDRNVFISPLSVSIALGMTWNGAVNTTKEEMEKTLRISGMSVSEINEYYKLMQSTLPAIDPKTKLSIANSIWYRNTFNVKQDFLKTNTDYFDAKVSALNFDDTKSVDIINQWVSDNTSGLIKKVLDQISANQMMFLINAVYFKGAWVKQFDKEKTYEADFTNELNQKVRVNMMNMTDTFAYADDAFAQYLDMPYGNKAFSMTIILPKEGNRAIDAFSQLDKNRLNQITEKMVEQKVILHMPRFKTGNKIQLKPVLQAMGMQEPFRESAEFDGISTMKPLFIGMVQHDTYVEVTEEGTEAAAVTTIGMETTSMPVIPYIIVNKPFAFVIREKSSGIILFMGKMGDVEKF